MTSPPRLPRVAAWLLTLAFLGDRRLDIEADLTELFDERRRARSSSYAHWRLYRDVMSVIFRPRRMATFFTDARFALRLFRKHAGIVSVTVGGLGLAIAMCTTVFSILNAAILQPFEMDDPSTVFKVQRVYERGNSTSWPYSAFVELQRGSTVAKVEASLSDNVRFADSSDGTATTPEPILFVSGGYLPMLGGRAVMGRTLDASDDRPGTPPVVVISHAFWQRHFSGDRMVVGRTLRLSGGSVTVAGVLRPKFSGPIEKPPSFWAPFATYGALFSGAAISPTSKIHVNVLARTPARTGVSVVQDQLSGVASGLPAVGFDTTDVAPEKTTGAQLRSAASRIDGPDAGSLYLVIGIIFLIVGLVLALACANVANLLLAGASSRAREFGVRIAMGASRQRLLSQLLSESLVIGAAAGVLGFFLSIWMVPSLARIIGLPPSYDVTPNLEVMLFTTAIAIASGIGAGLAPARYGARSDVAGMLKSQSLQAGASPQASRLRRGFIAFQAAASMLLLVTSALFVRAALHITHVDIGFDAGRLVTVGLEFPRSSTGKAADEEARIAAYFRTAVDRVSAVPAVEDVSLALSPPFGPVAITSLKRNGAEYVIVNNRTDAGYFKTAGFRIVRGRGYTPEEVAGQAPVALVSESLVRDFLPGVEPIGASLEPMMVAGGKGVTIIGVVADALVTHVRGGAGTTYRPIGRDPDATPHLIVRSREPDHVIRDVEAALATIDARVRPTSTLMRENVAKFLNAPKILAGLSGSVAFLALVLSVLGIFGVTSFVVGQRTQEVSVRMAMGASAGSVVRLMIRQNLSPVAGGLTVGLVLALAGSRVLTGALSGISPFDALAIVPAVFILSITALAAVALPAVRAARTDPAAVLRQQ